MKIKQGLQSKRDSLPKLFANSPLVLDGAALGNSCRDLDMQALRALVLDLGFIPVGMRNLPEECLQSATQAGWAVLRSPRAVPPRVERATAREPIASQKPSVEVAVSYTHLDVYKRQVIAVSNRIFMPLRCCPR